jgi:hypothetical protein
MFNWGEGPESEERDRQDVAQLRSEEAARLEAIRRQEREMLELRKEPLKKYLMEPRPGPESPSNGLIGWGSERNK